MQDFVNRQFFNITVFTLLFGVMFYDMISIMGFDYVDEICAVLLLLLFGYKVYHSKTWEFNKLFLIVLGIFIFYLIYSFVINANSPGGIITDFIIQIKPYLAFFCAYALHPTLSDNQRNILRQLVILCSLYVLVIGLCGKVNFDIIFVTFSHPSRFATASSILAILYLYCCDYTKADKMIFVGILAIGLLSGRSKHFGFFALSVLMIFYLNGSFKMKLNFKNTFFIVAAIALTLFVARDKIYFYFIEGGFGKGRGETDLYARMALYFFAFKILVDYLPFGPGFGTYATFASGSYYSPIYAKYGMEKMHGLSKDAPEFIADTYYPALAQFGVVGVVLFFWFWAYWSAKALKAYNKGLHKESVISLIIIFFFIIECTSDATLTHNRGMFMMMMLGLINSDIHCKNINNKQLSENK